MNYQHGEPDREVGHADLSHDLEGDVNPEPVISEPGIGPWAQEDDTRDPEPVVRPADPGKTPATKYFVASEAQAEWCPRCDRSIPAGTRICDYCGALLFRS